MIESKRNDHEMKIVTGIVQCKNELWISNVNALLYWASSFSVNLPQRVAFHYWYHQHVRLLLKAKSAASIGNKFY